MILLEFLRLLTMSFMAMGAADGDPAPPDVPQAAITDPSFSIAGRSEIADIDFGTDSSPWANDGECDDPRFTGPGMTATSLLDSDIRADASDCLAAWRDGRLSLRDDVEIATEAVTEGGIDFGTDSSPWANDGECDDPRFTGPGMTTTSLLDSDIRADASDCLAAWRAGTLTLIGADDSTRSAPAKSIAN